MPPLTDTHEEPREEVGASTSMYTKSLTSPSADQSCRMPRKAFASDRRDTRTTRSDLRGDMVPLSGHGEGETAIHGRGQFLQGGVAHQGDLGEHRELVEDVSRRHP